MQYRELASIPGANDQNNFYEHGIRLGFPRASTKISNFQTHEYFLMKLGRATKLNFVNTMMKSKKIHPSFNMGGKDSKTQNFKFYEKIVKDIIMIIYVLNYLRIKNESIRSNLGPFAYF